MVPIVNSDQISLKAVVMGVMLTIWALKAVQVVAVIRTIKSQIMRSHGLGELMGKEIMVAKLVMLASQAVVVEQEHLALMVRLGCLVLAAREFLQIYLVELNALAVAVAEVTTIYMAMAEIKVVGVAVAKAPEEMVLALVCLVAKILAEVLEATMPAILPQ
jgi:hypothetical protein